MDISLARQQLQTTIASKQADLDALTLAKSILDTTFKADFTAKETAQAEADSKSAELNAEKAKTASHQAEVDALNATLTDKEAVITDLQSQVALMPVQKIDSPSVPLAEMPV
jgi:uncharacterized coiled-coil protein SlyX